MATAGAAVDRVGTKYGTSFATGSPPLIQRHQWCYVYEQRQVRVLNSKSVSISIVRCGEKEKEGNRNGYVWIGRFAMLGFAGTVTFEYTTGKGLLQNIGVATPLPTAALVLTAFVGLVTALFIFQSASNDN